MSEFEPTQIVFSKDGMIADVQENAELLRQIEHARALPPQTLFKLVTFFLGYPTNKPLAKHLALFAALSFVVASFKQAKARQKQAKVRQDQEIVSSTGEEARNEPDKFLGQTLADWEDGWNESGRDEMGENPLEVRLAQIKWVSHSGVGLLVEAVKIDDTDKLAYYVVGVSPDPTTLPED